MIFRSPDDIADVGTGEAGDGSDSVAEVAEVPEMQVPPYGTSAPLQAGSPLPAPRSPTPT